MFTQENIQISKNYNKIHENLQVAYIILEISYQHPSKIRKIYTNHQE